MRRVINPWKVNLQAAQERWPGRLDDSKIQQLNDLVHRHGLLVPSGDVQLLDGKWYVTHSGLLRLAMRKHCSGIQTEIVAELSDQANARWVFKATVFKNPQSNGFVGYGDADPSNVSPLVRGAEMRVAETRAVNRALRKAYGIGLCSIEELGAGATRMSTAVAAATDPNNGKGRPRLRDRLLLLIRQYRLDAEQVKRYAARFCGTNSLREATREQVESFINHLASRAAEDRDKLLAEMDMLGQNSEAANGKREGISGHTKKDRGDEQEEVA